MTFYYYFYWLPTSCLYVDDVSAGGDMTGEKGSDKGDTTTRKRTRTEYEGGGGSGRKPSSVASRLPDWAMLAVKRRATGMHVDDFERRKKGQQQQKPQYARYTDRCGCVELVLLTSVFSFFFFCCVAYK